MYVNRSKGILIRNKFQMSKIRKFLRYMGNDEGTSLLALVAFISIEYMFLFSFFFTDWRLLSFVIICFSGFGAYNSNNHFWNHRRKRKSSQ